MYHIIDGTNFSLEVFWQIFYHSDGLEREQIKIIYKHFYEFKYDIKSNNPAKDREIRLFSDIDIINIFLYGHIDIASILITHSWFTKGLLLIGASKYGYRDFIDKILKYQTNAVFILVSIYEAYKADHIDIITILVRYDYNINWYQGNMKYYQHLKAVEYAINEKFDIEFVMCNLYNEIHTELIFRQIMIHLKLPK